MKKKANELSIDLNFHNYKLLDNHSFNLSGSYIYFIKGGNEQGKTSIRTAIATGMTAKNVTPEPVTRGKKEGMNTMTLPAADGEMYQVIWSFTNGKSSFVVVSPDGTKISSVEKIRNLFKYTSFTAEEWYQYSLSADGIRKQQQIILSLMSKEEQEAYANQSDIEATYFEMRKDKKKELDILVKQSVELTGDETAKLNNLSVATQRIEMLKGQLAEAEKVNIKQITCEAILKDFKALYETISNYKYDKVITNQVWEVIADGMTTANDKIGEIFESLEVVDLSALKDKILTGEKYLAEINAIKVKKENVDNHRAIIKKVQKELEDYEAKLSEAREEKKRILRESSLPIKDIELTDEGVTIEGFKFNESQVCKSRAIKTIAAIMCKINPSPILLIGSANDLDNKSLEELNELAKQENKIMILDEVVRLGDPEVYVEGFDLI